VNKPYIPRCGDVGFAGYEGGIVPASIGYYSTGKGESATKAHHQFQVLRYERIIQALTRTGVIVELWPATKERIEDHKGAHYIIFRPPQMNWRKMDAIDDAAEKIKGRFYGFLEIPLQAMDGRLRKMGLLSEKRSFFAYLGALFPWTMICSGVGNYCLGKAWLMPKCSAYWPPDGTFDAVVRLGWEVVCVDEGGEVYWGLNTEKGVIE